jgi:hypothetical protein
MIYTRGIKIGRKRCGWRLVRGNISMSSNEENSGLVGGTQPVFRTGTAPKFAGFSGGGVFVTAL